MALPGDVTTFTLTFGDYTNILGSTALSGISGKITPVNSQGKPVALTHVSTGRRIVPEPIEFTIASDGTGSVGQLPHTDNASLSPDEFLYKVEWNLKSSEPSPGNAMIAVPTVSGTTVDYDLLVPVASSAPVSVSLPAVTSVVGISGAIQADDLADALDDVLATRIDASGNPLGDAARAAYGVAAADAASPMRTALGKVFAAGRDAPRNSTVGTKTTISSTTRTSFMDRNGALLRGGSSNKLEKSTDGGTTWTTVYTFTAFVASVRQMDNGELLVALSESGATKSALMVSSGYESGGVSFTQKLTASNLGQAIELRWSGIGAGAIYTVSEYDSKAAGSRSANQRAWITQDSGGTWTEIYDHGTGSVGTRHVHGVIYDPYRDAVWLSLGDYATAGDGARAFKVSWNRGSTWTTITTDFQPTMIWAFPDCVIAGSDSPPNGVWRIDRPSTTNLALRLAYELNKTNNGSNVRILTHVSEAPFRDPKPGSPLLLPYTSADSTSGGQTVLCLMTTDGYAFSELWRSTDLWLAGKGPTNAVGPTPGGKAILTGQDATGWFQVEVDMPTPGVTSEIARVTRHLSRAIPKRAYRQTANQSSPAFQVVTTSTWTELLLSLATPFWVDDIAGLFTPSPDGLGVIVNREAVLTVTVDSGLAGLASGLQVAVARNGTRRMVSSGSSSVTTLIRAFAGERISGWVFHSSGADRTCSGTNFGLVLDTWETY